MGHFTDEPTKLPAEGEEFSNLLNMYHQGSVSSLIHNNHVYLQWQADEDEK